MGAPILDEAAIFNVARQMQEPEARRHYLDAVCTNDQQLLARIEALLRVGRADAGPDGYHRPRRPRHPDRSL